MFKITAPAVDVQQLWQADFLIFNDTICERRKLNLWRFFWEEWLFFNQTRHTDKTRRQLQKDTRHTLALDTQTLYMSMHVSSHSTRCLHAQEARTADAAHAKLAKLDFFNFSKLVTAAVDVVAGRLPPKNDRADFARLVRGRNDFTRRILAS